jgi:hypothetical protein
LAALVTWTTTEPNPRVVDDTVTGARPVPARAAVCGLLLALSVTVRVPGREPEAVGLNMTLIVQLAPAARDVPHVFVWL